MAAFRSALDEFIVFKVEAFVRGIAVPATALRTILTPDHGELGIDTKLSMGDCELRLLRTLTVGQDVALPSAPSCQLPLSFYLIVLT